MSDNSPASKYNFSNSEVVQIVEKNDGSVIGKNVYQQKQTLAEATKEIQDLLVQLDRTYPNKTNEEKQAAIVQKVEQHIKRDPTLRDRLWSAFKDGGVEALKQMLDAVYKNPVVSISVEAIKGFLEAECSKP